MRNLLALVGLLVIGVAGLGWYLGWYKLSVARTTDGNLQINTTVDTQKAGTDSAGFFKNMATVVGSQIEKSGPDAKTSSPNSAPGGTPGPVVPVQGSTVNPLAPTAPSAPGSTLAPGVPNAPTNPAPGPIKLVPPK